MFNRVKTFLIGFYNFYRKIIFILVNSIFDPRFIFVYMETSKSTKYSYAELQARQNKKLRKLIHYVYKNIPYYKKLFEDNNIKPEAIRCTKDLEKIPILTKSIIKNNNEMLTPICLEHHRVHYFNSATGGTTGTPLKYRISRKARLKSICELYRGWGFAGYKLGDKIISFGGQSLGIKKDKPKIMTLLEQYALNMKKISAFDMNEDNMHEYVKLINKFQPRFIRGYPSAIYFLSRFIEKNSLNVFSPDAILTTSERLYENFRNKIEKIFKCEVFDGYGLRDGGITAYECAKHKGLHINMTQSILEVVNSRHEQIEEGEGKILATDLYNYSMPFIRYDTGDYAEVTNKKCNCGYNTPLLKSILGRSVDILYSPEGKAIHGWFFLYIFWKIQEGIDKYRVEQNKVDVIDIKIVKNDKYDKKQEQKIREVVKKRSPGWKVNFYYVNEIPPTKGGKYKFIVNNTK